MQRGNTWCASLPRGEPWRSTKLYQKPVSTEEKALRFFFALLMEEMLSDSDKTACVCAFCRFPPLSSKRKPIGLQHWVQLETAQLGAFQDGKRQIWAMQLSDQVGISRCLQVHKTVVCCCDHKRCLTHPEIPNSTTCRTEIERVIPLFKIDMTMEGMFQYRKQENKIWNL